MKQVLVQVAIAVGMVIVFGSALKGQEIPRAIDRSVVNSKANYLPPPVYPG